MMSVYPRVVTLANNWTSPRASMLAGIAGTRAESKMLKSSLLTQRQIRRIEQLPRGHRLIGVRQGAPLVRQPNGRLVRVSRDGRLASTSLVKRVQSYLEVDG